MSLQDKAVRITHPHDAVELLNRAGNVPFKALLLEDALAREKELLDLLREAAPDVLVAASVARSQGFSATAERCTNLFDRITVALAQRTGLGHQN